MRTNGSRTPVPVEPTEVVEKSAIPPKLANGSGLSEQPEVQSSSAARAAAGSANASAPTTKPTDAKRKAIDFMAPHCAICEPFS
jgi:hypothetical protein